MLDIHHLKQACIKTDASYSYCELNGPAMRLLHNPTQEDVLSWLPTLQCLQHTYFLALGMADNTQGKPLALTITSLELDYEVILTLQPLRLLEYAFGFSSACQTQDHLSLYTIKNLPTHEPIVLICNQQGHIIESNCEFDNKDAQSFRSKFSDLQTTHTQSDLTQPIPISQQHYFNIDDQLFSINRLKSLAIQSINKHQVPDQDNTLHAITLIPISQQDDSQHYFEALNASKKQAEQACDAKGRFLATMSHEIRSPLNAILNMAQLLLNTELTPKQKKYAEIAHTGGQTLMALINDILDFSKIEAGHFTLNMGTLNLNKLIDDLASLFWIRAAENNIELAISIDPDCDQLFIGDEQRIRQILINLINNAIKFTEKGGVHINIEKTQSNSIKIEVIDTGIGMTGAECKEVFGAFIQAESSENRRFGGTGLGLSIVKQLIDIMQGEISVQSVPNEGSIFTVTLPLPLAQASDITDATPDLPSLRNKNTPKQAQITQLPCHYFTGKKVAAFLDCDNATVEAALAKQLSYWGISVYYIRDTTRTLTAPIETAYFFGEADEFRENAMHYHQVADYFLSAKNYIFVCISDMRIADQMRYTLHRGFTLALDKPLSTHKLIEVLDKRKKNTDNINPAEENTLTKILLVEDGETNRAVALALLEHHNITADIACNGKEALEQIKSTHYPLILMDLSMPIMDGLEATSHIRAGNSSNKETPIIALTANAFAEDRATCLAAGMNDYISKPIDTDIFDQKIEHWLQTSNAPQNASTSRNHNLGEANGESIQSVTKQLDPTPKALNRQGNDDAPITLDPRVLQQLIKDTSESSIGVILGIYFKELDERIPQMELLLAQEMWSTLGEEAHILKSSSASFGAIALSAKAKIIELNVKTNELGNVRKAMLGIDFLAQETVQAQRDFLDNRHH